jgi:hypothetical protein
VGRSSGAASDKPVVIMWDGLNVEERESVMRWMTTSKYWVLWKQNDSKILECFLENLYTLLFEQSPVRREYSVVVTPVLVFSSSVVEIFSSSSDAVGVVLLDLASEAPDMRLGSRGRGLCRYLGVSCMLGTDTKRNQYSFLNMPEL